jgi:DNA-binding CsgD family transcriptional regulator
MVTIPIPSVRKALDFMLDVTAIEEPQALVRTVVERLPRLVDSELTTLSICDLQSGTRRVISYPRDAIAAGDQACFNRLIHTHPLVRYHSTHADGGAQRISDCTDWGRFRRQELYGDYYRRIGIDHVVAVPVVASSGLVMSYVLNRRGRDFDDRECALLDAMRPALANLYRFASWAGASSERDPPVGERLTPREEEVLRCVAAGKSDKQVAAALGTSVRTVHKHLENAYTKLGVSNRTAAAMRLEGMRSIGSA